MVLVGNIYFYLNQQGWMLTPAVNVVLNEHLLLVIYIEKFEKLIDKLLHLKIYIWKNKHFWTNACWMSNNNVEKFSHGTVGETKQHITTNTSDMLSRKTTVRLWCELYLKLKVWKNVVCCIGNGILRTATHFEVKCEVVIIWLNCKNILNFTEPSFSKNTTRNWIFQRINLLSLAVMQELTFHSQNCRHLWPYPLLFPCCLCKNDYWYQINWVILHFGEYIFIACDTTNKLDPEPTWLQPWFCR